MKKIILAIGNDEQRKLCRLYLENLVKKIEIIELNSFSGLKELCQIRLDFDYVFASDDLRQGTAADIYNYCSENLPSTMFILYNQSYPENFPEPEEFNSGNSDFMLNNLSFDRFLDEVSRITGDLYCREKLYRKIPIISLYRYNKSLCDIFVRLSDEKFVKVQKADSYYSRIDLDTYRQRGMKHLYISDDDFRKFDVSFSKMSFLEKDEDFARLSPQEMLNRLSDVHLVINDIAKEVGISERSIQLAEENAKRAMFFIVDHPGIESLFIKKISQQDYLYDHSYFTAIVCTEIFTKIGLGTHENIKKFCMASIFHDMTIKNPALSSVKGAKDPRLLDFTHDEVKNYLKHPTLTANLMESMGIFSEDTVEMVRYHHITPEGGFPEKIHISRLSTLCATFIVAHEFVSKLYDNDFNIDALDKIAIEMALRFKEPNFKLALSAFDAAKEIHEMERIVA